MWEEITKDSTGKKLEEIEATARALKCSREVAHYFLKLEERLDRIEEYADTSHGRMIESIDHVEMVMQHHLEE